MPARRQTRHPHHGLSRSIGKATSGSPCDEKHLARQVVHNIQELNLIHSAQPFRTCHLDTRRAKNLVLARRASRMRRSLLFFLLTKKNPASSTHCRPNTTSPRDLRSRMYPLCCPELQARHGSRYPDSELEAHLRGSASTSLWGRPRAHTISSTSPISDLEGRETQLCWLGENVT